MSTATFTVGPVWTEIDYDNDVEVRELIVEWARWPVGAAARFNKKLRQLIERDLWDGKKTLFSLRSHQLPSGLVGPLARYLRGHGVRVAVRRDSRPPRADLGGPPAFPGFTWTPAQVEALVVARETPRGIFQMSVATGKGELIAGLLATFSSLPTLVLVGGDSPTDLADDLNNRFTNRLGRDLGYVGSGIWEPGHVTIALIPTLWARFSEPATQQLLRETQLLIMDEVQGATSKTAAKVLAACPAPRRYGFSARALDQSGNERPKNLDDAMITGRFGPIIFELKQYQVTVRIWRIPVPSGVHELAPFKAARKQGIIANRFRNGLIARASASWAAQGLSTLVQFQSREHGRELAKLNGGALLMGTDTRSRRREVRESFNAKRTRLVNASRIFDVGVDLPAMDRYILADPGKNYRRLVQRIGRAARKRTDKSEVIVLDPYPTGYTKLEAHNRKRLKCYRQEGFIVEEKG